MIKLTLDYTVEQDMLTFIMNNTFDDIKRSEYMSEIKKLWMLLGFDSQLSGEKFDNLCIACFQVFNYLATAPENSVFEHNGININCFNVTYGKYKESIFAIIRRIYEQLPLSDYDYIELLDKFEHIEFTRTELKHMTQRNFGKKVADNIIKQITLG